MTAWYNEIDPKAAAWLRELIKDGLIVDGDVDERDIREVQPGDLAGYEQCHFFAGIGGWSYALRLAGWADDVPVWTGSCPCQGLSAAGKGLGAQDERHLWPDFFRLIRECKPPVVFGEQVASAIGLGWIAGVRVDLEDAGYAVGAADLCAAGVGAPHIRQRLYWVANAERAERRENIEHQQLSSGRQQAADGPGGNGSTHRVADTTVYGCGQAESQSPEDGSQAESESDRQPQTQSEGHGNSCRLGHSDRGRCLECRQPEPGRLEGPPRQLAGGSDPWRASTVILCRDGKYRRIPIEPALFPLADGLPGRVGLLRGAGNAIVPQVAAQFIGAVMECLSEAALQRQMGERR